MKTNKLLLLAVTGIATFGFQAPARAPQTLVRSLVANSTDIYKVASSANWTLQSDALGQLPANFTTALTCKINIGNVNATDGTADVSTDTTVDSFKTDGFLAGLIDKKQFPKVSQKGTIDKRDFLNLSMPNGDDLLTMALSGASNTSLSAMLIQLPDHPVSVGDSWDMTVPKSIYTTAADQKLKAKLTGDKQVDGRNVWVISISGQIDTDCDSSKFAQSTTAQGDPLGGHQVIIKGPTTLTGEATVDKATGQTVTYDLKGSMNLSIELVDMSVKVQATGPVTSSVKLQAPPSA